MTTLGAGEVYGETVERNSEESVRRHSCLEYQPLQQPVFAYLRRVTKRPVIWKASFFLAGHAAAGDL